MKQTTRISGLTLLLALIFLVITIKEAKADFIVDPNPGGEKFYILDAYKDVSFFTGNVGGNNSGPVVDVNTVGNVDTGSGYSNITPVKDSTLTDLTFTPHNTTLFGDFSFQGQLKNAGTITLNVWDNNNVMTTFTFSIEKANKDFDRIGIIAGSGETIEMVEIINSGFKEVKQIDFSYAAASVPEPATLLLLGSGLLGLWGARRKFKK